MTDSKLDWLADNTLMYVSGGQDYWDEQAHFETHGHPILTVEMGNIVRRFKLTSADLTKSPKDEYLQRGFYILREPEKVQLNQTYKMSRNPGMANAVDLNHTVYIREDNTPPLKVYPNGYNHNYEWQTQFEVSHDDKVGILAQMARIVQSTGEKIRTPKVSEEECRMIDARYHNKLRVHPIQVDELMKDRVPARLSLDELSYAISAQNALIE